MNLLSDTYKLINVFIPPPTKTAISFTFYPTTVHLALSITLILRRSRTGTVWFYTSTSNKRAA